MWQSAKQSPPRELTFQWSAIPNHRNKTQNKHIVYQLYNQSHNHQKCHTTLVPKLGIMITLAPRSWAEPNNGFALRGGQRTSPPLYKQKPHGCSSRQVELDNRLLSHPMTHEVEATISTEPVVSMPHRCNKLWLFQQNNSIHYVKSVPLVGILLLL